MYKIAFFGSDLFSLASFKLILKLKNERPDLINGLSLVTRKLKVSGRGMKNIYIPSIVQFAQSNQLAWYEVDKDEEFGDLANVSNLAIAVSYGKLIPASYLQLLKYGGLNVHPSLLPQYRGAAPIQWAIMDRKAESGVSVQTLHPTKFDHGRLLWQSSGIPLHHRETTDTLTARLGEIGASGLINVLTSKDLLNPSSAIESPYSKSKAPVIEPAMSKIDFRCSSGETDAKGRALGKLYFEQRVEQKQPKRGGKPKGHPLLRVNLTDFEIVTSICDETEADEAVRIGDIKMGTSANNEIVLALKMKDGYIGAKTVTVQGFKRESAENYFAQIEKRKLRNSLVDGDLASIENGK